MQDENIVKSLIRGSHNLDRMRKEIHEVVAMVIGFAFRGMPGILDMQINAKFESDTCIWSVIGEVGHQMNPKLNQLVVRCRLKDPWGLSSGYSSNPNDHVFKSTDVQRVHRDLPTFLEGMMTTFPLLEEQWAHIIEASKVTL